MSICAYHVHEQESSMQSVRLFNVIMILSTWNFEYALALQSTKTI